VGYCHATSHHFSVFILRQQSRSNLLPALFLYCKEDDQTDMVFCLGQGSYATERANASIWPRRRGCPRTPMDAVRA